MYVDLSLSFDVFITYKLNKETKKSKKESKAEDNNAKLQVEIQTTHLTITSITAVILAITTGVFISVSFVSILINIR